MKWRVIMTDTEQPTGVAPVCDHAEHPVRTPEEDVLDCCPKPWIEVWSRGAAVALAGLLTAVDADNA